MTDQVDHEVHFRNAINQRYNLYTWITAFTCVACLILLLLVDTGRFTASFLSMTCAMSVGLMARNFNHKVKMLQHLNRSDDDHFSRLENYLEAKQHQWKNNLWTRLIVGVTAGVAMLFLLLFNAATYWSMTTASFFILFVLAIAILGWINFLDQILLHDLRRTHRDDHSNDPE